MEYILKGSPIPHTKCSSQPLVMVGTSPRTGLVTQPTQPEFFFLTSNDHVIHGVSLVTEVIDSCSQAGGVPQAMGDHGPTPCRRQKEEVDVPTFLLQTSLATSFLFDKTRSFRVRDCCHQTENPVTGGEDTGCTGEGVASPTEAMMELQNKFSREQWFRGSFSDRRRSYSSSS